MNTEKKPTEPKKTKSKFRLFLRLVGVGFVLMIGMYSFRFVQLRNGIKNEFIRNSKFQVGTVEGKLACYYLNETPISEEQVGVIGPWKLSNNEEVEKHPDLIATLALQHFAFWKQEDGKPEKKELARTTFFKLSEEIHDMFVRKETASGQKYAVVEYHFVNPWYPQLTTPWRSALAQGRCLSVLARHYQEKPEPETLELIKDVIASYEIPVQEGGVKAEHNGDWFYEEVAEAPATHILNGHIIALWGLYDVYRVTSDKLALDLYQKGMDTVFNNLGEYDTFPWSTYDLGPNMWAGTANPKYQLFHSSQMKVLYDLTNQSEYLEYSRQWEKELNSWQDQICYLFLKDYYRVVRKLKLCLL